MISGAFYFFFISCHIIVTVFSYIFLKLPQNIIFTVSTIGCNPADGVVNPICNIQLVSCLILSSVGSVLDVKKK